MSGIHDLSLFIFSGILFNMAPGPDTLYVASRGAAAGARGGAVAALGIAAGCCVHILAAAFGLTAILAASATAFTVVKYAGAAYLIWTGLSMLRPTSGRAAPGPGGARGQTRAAGSGYAAAAAASATDTRRIFFQGFLTNALNPKVALFFLAFLPQFIDPRTPDKAWAFLLLGCILNATGTAWNLLLGLTAARLAGRVRRGMDAGGQAEKFGRWATRGAGALFVLLGIRLAVSDRF